MDAIVLDFVEFLVGELKTLPHWGNAYGLAYHNKENKLQLYPTPSNPNPSPAYIGPQDILGTYVYIREVEDVRGSSGEEDGYGACNYVERVTKRLRAVAVSSNLKNLSASLATRVYLDLFRVDLYKYKNYTLDQLRLTFNESLSNFDRLVEDELKVEVNSCNLVMGGLDFDLNFLYAPKCNRDTINIC